MRYDHSLYLELSLCHEWGIPHSEFLEWDTQDRDKAVAFYIEKSAKCDLCGTADWEWEEDRRAYTPIESFCLGCYLKEQLQEDAGTQAGTSVTLIPTKSLQHDRIMVKQAKAYRERRGGA